MKLSRQEKINISQLNSRLVAALILRSFNRNDFDTNIVFLKELRLVFNELLAIQFHRMEPLVDAFTDARCDIIALQLAKYNISQFSSFSKQIHSRFYNKPLLTLFKNEFSNTLITSLHYDEKHYEKSKTRTFNGCSIFSKSEYDLNKYGFKFSDGSRLIWDTLEDGPKMKQIKILFEDKVKQLSETQVATSRRATWV